MSRGLFLNFLFHFIGVSALLLYHTVLVRNPPAMQETWVRALGWEDPLEKGRVPTPIFWLGEFHGPYSLWCHQESDTHEQLSLSLSYCFKYHSFIIWLEIRKCNAFSFVLSQNFFLSYLEVFCSLIYILWLFSTSIKHIFRHLVKTALILNMALVSRAILNITPSSTWLQNIFLFTSLLLFPSSMS